jgi:hypothetical protein
VEDVAQGILFTRAANHRSSISPDRVESCSTTFVELIRYSAGFYAASPLVRSDFLFFREGSLAVHFSMIGQVSLSVAYGIDTAPRNDPNIALAESALQGVEAAQTKGRIFNLLPFCKPNQLRPGCCRLP